RPQGQPPRHRVRRLVQRAPRLPGSSVRSRRRAGRRRRRGERRDRRRAHPVPHAGRARDHRHQRSGLRSPAGEQPQGGLSPRTLQPRATDRVETLPVGLVFRSVGYRGVALPGVPFNDKWGVILNERGRVLDPLTKQPVVGEYTGGWIKRGPSGVIGTNKPDAAETVACMLEDLARGAVLHPATPGAAAADALVRSRQPQCLSYDDWRYLDRLEVERGRALGRPRVKLTRLDEILGALRDRGNR